METLVQLGLMPQTYGSKKSYEICKEYSVLNLLEISSWYLLGFPRYSCLQIGPLCCALGQHSSVAIVSN